MGPIPEHRSFSIAAVSSYGILARELTHMGLGGFGGGGGGGRGDGGVVRGGGDEGVGGEVLGKKRREEALCRDLVVVGAREVGVQFVLFVLLRLGERER